MCDETMTMEQRLHYPWRAAKAVSWGAEATSDDIAADVRGIVAFAREQGPVDTLAASPRIYDMLAGPAFSPLRGELVSMGVRIDSYRDLHDPGCWGARAPGTDAYIAFLRDSRPSDYEGQPWPDTVGFVSFEEEVLS